MYILQISLTLKTLSKSFSKNTEISFLFHPPPNPSTKKKKQTKKKKKKKKKKSHTHKKKKKKKKNNNRISYSTLRKHAYSNIWKISPKKKMIFFFR